MEISYKTIAKRVFKQTPNCTPQKQRELASKEMIRVLKQTI